MIEKQNNYENCVRYNDTWIPFANINRVYMRRHNDSVEYYFEADVGMQEKADNGYKLARAYSKARTMYTTVYGKLSPQQYEKVHTLLFENAKKKELLKKEKEAETLKRKKRVRKAVFVLIILVTLLILTVLLVLRG